MLLFFIKAVSFQSPAARALRRWRKKVLFIPDFPQDRPDDKESPGDAPPPGDPSYYWRKKQGDIRRGQTGKRLSLALLPRGGKELL